MTLLTHNPNEKLGVGEGTGGSTLASAPLLIY